MEGKACWCCGLPLFSDPERLDGVCLNCGLDEFAALDLPPGDVKLCRQALEELKALARAGAGPFELPRAAPER